MGALQNQIYLYSLDTSSFYTDIEHTYHNRLMKSHIHRNKVVKEVKKLESLKGKNKITEEQLNELKRLRQHMKNINKIINTRKIKLRQTIMETGSITRTLRSDSLKDNKVIGLFESTLTRSCDFKTDEKVTDIMVIQIYHYEILDSIINNGYLFNGEKYVYYSSSAGQIRTKKIVTIKESLLDTVENKLTCELTVDAINSKGGINPNKYQAYLALTNSASDVWKKFNIDRSIVVDDFETLIHSEVDFIDRETYEIERKVMDIPIPHMDGCGIMLPSVSRKPYMYRMPWHKGLLVTFDFKKFAEEKQSTKIKDIYGKEYDIVEDKINVIFTKSQFKMWKYYDSWDDYKDKFKKHECEAVKLNEEDIGGDALLNYQMLQTLTDITDEELQELCESTISDVLQIGTDKETMLRVLGATKENTRKNYFQQALYMYPELLNDEHARQVIKDKKRSLVRDSWAGKINVKGKYTFLIPDLYAFCEWLFLGVESPTGLLGKDEVYCSLYKEGKLDILRSPHLYKEHAIRKNTLKEECKKWLITKGIYTSVYDNISKILQFDVDGDKALVIQDETLVRVAERNMQGVVPLYYEMESAKSEHLDGKQLYISLTSAYKANIGIISNDITKIWNSENPNVNAVKWLTAYNNYVIDYAKTLYLPTPTPEAEEIIKSFTKNKTPHFFVYAKDKDEKQVEPLNNSTVNRLRGIVPNKPIQFKKIAGTMDYKNLMNGEFNTYNDDIFELFLELEKVKLKHNSSESKQGTVFHTTKIIREEMLGTNHNIEYIVDVLVSHLYKKNFTKSRTTLWDVFGDVILVNLEKNIKNTIQCESCGTRIKVINNKTKYCTKCSKQIKNKQNKAYYHLGK